MNKLVARAQSDDRSAEVDGVWVEYTPDGEEFFPVKIRKVGAQNDGLIKAAEAILRPFRENGLEMDDLPTKKQREIGAKLFSEHVVLDWDAERFGVPFSPEECERTMLLDLSFAEFLGKRANKTALFRKKTQQDAAGN